MYVCLFVCYCCVLLQVSEGTENIKTSRVIALTVDVEDDYTQVEIPSGIFM